LTVYSVALLLVCVPFLILSVSDFAPLAVLESPDFSKIRSWLKTSKSFVITNTLQLGLNGWDILIMGAFASLAETGRYAAATRLAMIVMVVVRVANTTMGHRFSAIHSNSDFDRNEHLFKFARWICASAGVLVFIVLILAVNYLVPLLGDGFSGIETMVLLIAAANLVIVFMGPITGFLNMTGREAFVARCMTTWSILSVLLNFMLIPFFQAWGAVAALVVCNVGLRLQMIVRAPKLLSVKI